MSWSPRRLLAGGLLCSTLVLSGTGCTLFFDFSRTVQPLDEGDVLGRAVKGEPAEPAPFSLVTTAGGGRRTRAGVTGLFRVRGLPQGVWTLQVSEDEDGDGRVDRLASPTPVLISKSAAAEETKNDWILLGDVSLTGPATVTGTVTWDPATGPAPVVLATQSVDLIFDEDGAGQSFVAGEQLRAGVRPDGTFVLEGLEERPTSIFATRTLDSGALELSNVVSLSAPDAVAPTALDEDLVLATPDEEEVETRVRIAPPPEGPVEVIALRAGASTNPDLREPPDTLAVAEGEADDGDLALSLPLGVAFDLYLRSDEGQGALLGQLLPPGVELRLGPLALGPPDPACAPWPTEGPDYGAPRDCDDDNLPGLPLVETADGFTAELAVWQGCIETGACDLAFGTEAGQAACTVDGVAWDCDDDGDGQPDVTEPPACYGPGAGGDRDGDGLCDVDDPFPLCPEETDPSDCEGEFVPPGVNGAYEGEPDFSPRPIIVLDDLDGIGNPVRLAAGDSHSCALASSGDVYCWGGNGSGQLGVGDVDVGGPASSPEPLYLKLASGPSFTLGLGARHSCAISFSEDTGAAPEPAGVLQCWGDNTSGQVDGDPASAEDTSLPVALALGPAGQRFARLVDGGQAHTCAIADDGALYCWGDNAAGQLTASEGGLAAPAQAGPGWRNLATGADFTCASTDDGALYCGGASALGQLGQPEGRAPGPFALVEGISGVDRIAAGDAHACAATATGVLYCWGQNDQGQAAPELLDESIVYEPRPVLGDTDDLFVLDVQAGESHTCAILDARDGDQPAGTDVHLRCWGAGTENELGGLPGEGESMVRVPLSGAPEGQAVGAHHTCAITEGTGTACWGRNDDAQTGNPDPASDALFRVGGLLRRVFRGGAAGGALTEAANWEPEGAPTADDILVFDDTSIGDAQLSGALAVRELRTEGFVNQIYLDDSADLSVRQNLIDSGVLALAPSATLTVGHDAYTSGSFSFFGPGSPALGGTLQVRAARSLVLDRPLTTLRLVGSTTWQLSWPGAGLDALELLAGTEEGAAHELTFLTAPPAGERLDALRLLGQSGAPATLSVSMPEPAELVVEELGVALAGSEVLLPADLTLVIPEGVSVTLDQDLALPGDLRVEGTLLQQAPSSLTVGGELSFGAASSYQGDPGAALEAGSLSIGGEFVASGTTTVSSLFEVLEGASFDPGTGELVLAPPPGSTVTLVYPDGTQLYDLRSEVGGATIELPADTLIVVENELILTGEAGAPLSIRSDQGGVSFSLEARGLRTVADVAITDGTNTTGVPLAALDSTFANVAGIGPPSCGNGFLEVGEQCEDHGTNANGFCVACQVSSPDQIFVWIGKNSTDSTDPNNWEPQATPTGESLVIFDENALGDIDLQGESFGALHTRPGFSHRIIVGNDGFSVDGPVLHEGGELVVPSTAGTVQLGQDTSTVGLKQAGGRITLEAGATIELYGNTALESDRFTSDASSTVRFSGSFDDPVRLLMPGVSFGSLDLSTALGGMDVWGPGEVHGDLTLGAYSGGAISALLPVELSVPGSFVHESILESSSGFSVEAQGDVFLGSSIGGSVTLASVPGQTRALTVYPGAVLPSLEIADGSWDVQGQSYGTSPAQVGDLMVTGGALTYLNPDSGWELRWDIGDVLVSGGVVDIVPPNFSITNRWEQSAGDVRLAGGFVHADTWLLTGGAFESPDELGVLSSLDVEPAVQFHHNCGIVSRPFGGTPGPLRLRLPGHDVYELLLTLSDVGVNEVYFSPDTDTAILQELVVEGTGDETSVFGTEVEGTGPVMIGLEGRATLDGFYTVRDIVNDLGGYAAFETDVTEDVNTAGWVTSSAICGNNAVDAGEDCDTSAAGGFPSGCTVGCNAELGYESCTTMMCTLDQGAGCGNGVIEQALGETCDDGNTVAGDGCDETCAVEGAGCYECFGCPSRCYTLVGSC